MNHN
ncbi:unnamed protein product [Gulo gulo]